MFTSVFGFYISICDSSEIYQNNCLKDDKQERVKYIIVNIVYCSHGINGTKFYKRTYWFCGGFSGINIMLYFWTYEIIFLGYHIETIHNMG